MVAASMWSQQSQGPSRTASVNRHWDSTMKCRGVRSGVCVIRACSFVLIINNTIDLGSGSETRQWWR